MRFMNSDRPDGPVGYFPMTSWKTVTSSKSVYTFRENDLVDLPALVTKLRQRGRPIDAWLAGQLSAPTRAALENPDGQSPGAVPLQSLLVEDLNEILIGPSIFTQQRFDGVDLRRETQKLLLQTPQRDELKRVNRLLIEDAYPIELSRNRRPADEAALDRLLARYREPIIKEIRDRLRCRLPRRYEDVEDLAHDFILNWLRRDFLRNVSLARISHQLSMSSDRAPSHCT